MYVEQSWHTALQTFLPNEDCYVDEVRVVLWMNITFFVFNVLISSVVYQFNFP